MLWYLMIIFIYSTLLQFWKISIYILQKVLKKYFYFTTWKRMVKWLSPTLNDVLHVDKKAWEINVFNLFWFHIKFFECFFFFFVQETLIFIYLFKNFFNNFYHVKKYDVRIFFFFSELSVIIMISTFSIFVMRFII